MGNRNLLARARRTWCAALLVAITAALLPLALTRPGPSAEAATKWVSSARVSPSSVPVGGTVAITASVTSPGTRTVLIDLEVHNAADQMVGQRFWDQQRFARDETRQYQWNWTVPATLAAGQYTVKIGVLGVGWGNTRHWNHSAATIQVSGVSSSTTSTSSSTTTTTGPTTTRPATTTTLAPTTTRPATTTTTMPHEMDCDGIPMNTPIGALPPAMPMLCDTLASGVASTFVNGSNSWVDDFDHGASMAAMGPGYLTFERSSLSSTAKTGHFRHNQHWMADVYAPGQTGGAQMRPDRSFRFENGKLVVEAVVAASISGYNGFAWPEITVTTASSPASSARGRVGSTPASSIGDDLYAYGQFGGEWAVGIRLHGRRPIQALYDDTGRGFPCGRVWEMSWFQNGESSGGGCSHPKAADTWGGGEWVPGGSTFTQCTTQDPDTFCRNAFRWELSQSKVTLYVNGVKWMEHTAVPGTKLLPDEMVNSPVYAYFSDWVYQPPNQVVRYHWDHVAINP